MLEGCVEEGNSSSSEEEGDSDGSDEEEAPSLEDQSQVPPVDKKVSLLHNCGSYLYSTYLHQVNLWRLEN